MALTLILALQAATAAPVTPPVGSRWALVDPAGLAPDGARDFDLSDYRPAPGGCAGGEADAEVVVCGRRRGGGAYPIEYWARIFGAEPPIRAEMDLGGNVQGRLYTESVAMDRGAVSKRALVGIRMPF